MKALQDRVKQLEDEKNELNNELNEKNSSHDRMLEEMKRKSNQDMKESMERENSLRKNLNEINEEVNRQRIEGSNSKSIQVKYENEVNILKIQANKLKEDLTEANTQMLIFRKEINILENEKSKHIEQNSLDRDQYDQKLDDILSKSKQREEYINKIEKDSKLICNEKNDLQNHLNKIHSENNLIDNKMKQKIDELEKKVKEFNRQNLEYHNMVIELQERLEVERITSQKKITLYEEKIKGLAKSYEDQINVISSFIIILYALLTSLYYLLFKCWPAYHCQGIKCLSINDICASFGSVALRAELFARNRKFRVAAPIIDALIFSLNVY